jgi:TRAP-type C4-dicarboxylate transport system substrate-binding protein
MIKKSLKILGGVLVAGGLAAAGTANAADLPKTNLKVIGPWSNSTTWKLNIEPFWSKEVPALSNGRVTADLTSMTEMGLKGPEIFRLIKIGVADMGSTVTGYASGEVPELDGLDLSGVALTIGDMRKVADAYIPALEKIMLNRAGVRPIVFWPTVQQSIWCAVPINGLDDMKGKKVRVFATTQADFMQAIGATPVTMAFSEVVPALQRKVIDCAVTGTLSGNLAKWPEVATHLYPIALGWSMWVMSANERAWQRQPDAVKDFLLKAHQDPLAKRAWTIADEGTNQGTWCSTGNSKCTWGEAKKVTRYNRTEVPVTAADKKRLADLVQSVALPKFAERCGAECTAQWNATVGKAVGMTAKAN